MVMVIEWVIAREKTEGGEIRSVRVESVKTIEEGKKKKC
jgi:hypothetical protein